MSKYGQYCPLSLASEVFCEKWNVLILRRLIEGSSRFNDIHKGMPRITATLLSSRLRDLERAEIITRTKLEKSNGYDYQLAPAGIALKPVIKALAIWGQEWGRDMVIEDLDPSFLLWQMHFRLNIEALPAGRTVIALEFSGTLRGNDRFWLVVTDSLVDLCFKNPGYDANITIMSDLRLFVEVWRGIRDLKTEISNKKIRVAGDRNLVLALPNILLLSELANIKRKRLGAEKTLSS